MTLDRQEQAWELLREAYRTQMEGDYDRAVELYKKSLAIFPTAEAHTFLGWTYHFQGKIDDAIAECKRAIEVDPEFGNPYNDIGSYLIQLEKYDEAIPWLERAIAAPRYEPRHFPHFNLGPRLRRQRHAHARGGLFQGIVAYRAALCVGAASGRKSSPHGELARVFLGVRRLAAAFYDVSHAAVQDRKATLACLRATTVFTAREASFAPERRRQAAALPDDARRRFSWHAADDDAAWLPVASRLLRRSGSSWF